MIKGDDFRFQRHMEIWKEQNKMIKRVITLTLLFGILILIRVLIPFSDNSEKYANIIRENEEEKVSLETQNRVLKQLEDALVPVQKTIERQPWMKEKDRLVRAFQDINRRNGSREEAQQTADSTIRTIASQARDQIVNPLKGVIDSNPDAADKLELSREINDLKQYINNWETEHINQRWYSTIVRKDMEMRDLTDALNARMSSVSSLLKGKVTAINKEIEAQKDQIKVHEANIVEANGALQEIMEELFPKWLQGILNIEQMIQLYPIILLCLLLYVFWIMMSLSRHYEYVSSRIEMDEQDREDISASSVWTLTGKGKRGTFITLVSYVLFILVVWSCFEEGSSLLTDWLTGASPDDLLMSGFMYQTLPWAGRIVFSVALSGIVILHRRKPPSAAGSY